MKKLTTGADAAAAEFAHQSLATRIADHIEKTRAKKGTLGLPKLLDERRFKYAMPNECFEMQAVLDRVLVWQLPNVNEDGTFTKGGKIIMSSNDEARAQNQANRGVIVSAGLSALDSLASHGMAVGHIIRFVRMNPWMTPVCNIEGKDIPLLVLRDGDIIGSEDLMANLKAKKVKIVVKTDKETGVHSHVYLDEKGKPWLPQNPWISDDY